MWLLLILGKLQDVYLERSAAWQWATGYVVLGMAWKSLFFPDFSPALLLSALFAFIYAWLYFALLRQVADNLLLWILVYAGEALYCSHPWHFFFPSSFNRIEMRGLRQSGKIATRSRYCG